MEGGDISKGKGNFYLMVQIVWLYLSVHYYDIISCDICIKIDYNIDG